MMFAAISYISKALELPAIIINLRTYFLIPYAN